jgi:integrase
MSGRKRSNGEGSIFPYRNGFAAYVWVTTPAGNRQRKYVYGKTREIVHEKWIKLHAEATRGPVVTKTPSVESYLTYWLREVVEPNLRPKTYEKYEMFVRLYIVPALGDKKLGKLAVRDVRVWLNKLRQTCQCCAQGKDARRPESKQRCCARGRCCERYPSAFVIQIARDVLRAGLSNAVAEELIPKNVVALVKVPGPRKPNRQPWSVDEARKFLESARVTHDPLYAAYVLILVLGLRKGEVLGLSWDNVNLDAGELHVSRQLQRVHGRLLHAETKTEGSSAVLPLPEICVTALRLREKDQGSARATDGDAWDESDLVFTTRYGRPVEPRNFSRSFVGACQRAGVRRIRVHDTRHTCSSLLAELDVHPRIAMQILRHSRIAMTMDVYTKASSSATREALRRLGERLED